MNMKKLVFCLFLGVSLIYSCSKEEETPIIVPQSPDGWHKILVNTNEDFLKVIQFKEEILIFSNEHCYSSNVSDLKKWEKREIPDHFPFLNHNKSWLTVHHNLIFFAGKQGLYSSRDAKTWEKCLDTFESFGAIASDEDLGKIYLFSGFGSYIFDDISNKAEKNSGLDSTMKCYWPRYVVILPLSSWFDGDTIFLDGMQLSSYVNFFSVDGVHWQQRCGNLTYDICRGQKVCDDHSGIIFYAVGDINIKKVGGQFFAVENYKGDYFFGGLTNKYYDNVPEGGIIVKNQDFDSAFFCQEQINDLEDTDCGLVAVGQNGAIYIYK